jgi:hypothetical protein
MGGERSIGFETKPSVMGQRLSLPGYRFLVSRLHDLRRLLPQRGLISTEQVKGLIAKAVH